MSQKAVNCKNILICSRETGSSARQEENRHKSNKERQLQNRPKTIIPASIRQARN
jgi:hypothetical protein